MSPLNLIRCAEEANRVYAQVLKNELFGSRYSDIADSATKKSPAYSVSTSTSTTPGPSTSQHSLRLTPPRHPLTSPRSVLQFRSPIERMKSARRLDFSSVLSSPTKSIDSPLSMKYSISNLETLSLKTLQSPRKPPRNIPKTPFKVLDAPDLADDFYLNLVDWGSTNLLSVGLGTQVYLWSACTSRVTRLCDVGPYDSVTSVNWVQRVCDCIQFSFKILF